MKAIEINIAGVIRYSTIEFVKNGLCFLSDRATDFIKSQSADEKMYYGNWEKIENPYAYEDGTIARFFIKPEQYTTCLVLKKKKQSV